MLARTDNGDSSSLWLNGINAEAKDECPHALSLSALSARIGEQSFRPLQGALPAALASASLRQRPTLAGGPWLNNISSVHWAAVVEKNVDPQVVEAIAPLVTFRQGKVLEWFQDDTSASFLSRNKVSLGNPDYERRVPFYLLIVADPSAVSFDEQYLLGLDYAVGRLWGTLDEMKRYSAAIVAIKECVPALTAPGLVVFAPNSDEATDASSRKLVEPLADSVDNYLTELGRPPCERIIGEHASKSRLLSLLSAPQPSGRVVFTATHGALFRSAEKRRDSQGGLVCQDWPGYGPALAEHLVAAADIPDNCLSAGNVFFHFACFSAGTPMRDSFWFARDEPLPEGEEFVARLPMRLLRSGAIAVIGHIDSTWCSSFNEESRGELFLQAVVEILAGERIGKAMYRFSATHAGLSATLQQMLETQAALRAAGVNSESLTILSTWLSKNDARSYSVIGDPAARISLGYAI